jgi:DNA-binding transcriptional LysR family regulator
MGIQLDDIDYFLAVAEEGQVRKGAQRLGISQPAVTKALQRLEKELGFALFERSVKGMTPTKVGEQFRQRTGGLRGALRDAVKEATDLHLGALGLLRVGVSPLYAHKLFVPAFVQLHRQRPAASVRALVHLNDELWRLLRQRELDMTLSSLPSVVPDDFQTIELMQDDLCIVARLEHPLHRKRRQKLADLAHVQWMLPGPDVAARRHVEALLAQAGMAPPRIALEVSNTAGQLRKILHDTDLVSLMSESMLEGRGGEGLEVLHLPQARIRRAVGITLLKATKLQPLASRFIELLTQSQLKSPPI